LMSIMLVNAARGLRSRDQSLKKILEMTVGKCQVFVMSVVKPPGLEWIGSIYMNIQFMEKLLVTGRE